MIQQIGGRKFLAALVMLVVAGILVVIKGDIPPNTVTFLEFIFGALVTGNVAAKISGAVAAGRADSTPDEPTPPVEPTPVIDHSDDLKALTDAVSNLSHNDVALAQNVAMVQQTLSIIIRKLQIDKMPDPQ